MALNAEVERTSSSFRHLSRTKRWLVTIAATIGSTYALDAVATAAGLLLAASPLPTVLDHPSVLMFLAGTYILWGAALRVNLRANWALLECTGTSTNVLSKAAYDLVKLKTDSVRAQKLAAAIGYVTTELVKEAPYYAGAFGAAVLIDSVTAKEALIFLGGANLGAALYEYGLARAVRAFLGNQRAYAAFETDWRAGDYLKEYYSTVEPDERQTIAFFVNAMRDVKPNEPILYFGIGPTLHHVFLAAGKASEIHLGDYLPSNLREIERWIRRDPAAHDWRPFVRFTLECEGWVSPSEEDITQREELARAKITKLIAVDIRCANPLDEGCPQKYDTVISAYCLDSATDNRRIWNTYMARLAGLVGPGGSLITAALRSSRGYLVGGRLFPSANVDEHDLDVVLKRYFDCETVTTEVRELAGTASKGYSGIVLAHARRATEHPW
jgi:hypothetical protein